MQRSISIRSLLLLVFVLLCAGRTAARAADPVAELGGFSVFQNVDPAQLLKSDVKTARGPAMSSGRDLSVQSVYVVPGPPAKALEALKSWNPAQHRELKILLHSEVPGGAPNAANFSSKLRSAFGSGGPARALAAATEKLGTELQISNEEAKKFSAAGGADAVSAFWADVLAGRASAYASGGVARQPGYEHTGQAIRPGDQLAGLLRQQGKVRQQFSSFLGATGVAGGGRPSLKPEMYWELLEVEDKGVLTLGAFFSQPAAGGSFQAADVLYYASGGYYVALTLYQMWPVDAGGQPATLVWRGDMISSASLASLHGMERLASESAMMKDVAKAVTLLRRDTAGR